MLPSAGARVLAALTQLGSLRSQQLERTGPQALEPVPRRHTDRHCGNHGVRTLESPPCTPPPLTVLFPPGHLSVGFHESPTSSQQST